MLVDEAHSSQSGETATELKGVLGGEELQEQARRRAEEEGTLVAVASVRAAEYAAHERQAAAMDYAGIGVAAALVVTGAALLIVDHVRRGRPAAAGKRARFMGAGMAVNF